MQIERAFKQTEVKKYLTHRFHNGVFLRVDKTVEDYPDGQVHITLLNVIPQMHLGTSLRHTNNALYMAHGDRQTSSCLKCNDEIKMIYRNALKSFTFDNT